MPIGASWESGSWVEDSWVDGSWGEDNTVAEFAWPLLAPATDSLIHAEQAGLKNSIWILAELADEDGDILVDQTGEVLIAYGETPVRILHTQATGTLLHAEV